MAYKKIGGIYVNSEDVYKAYSADGKYYVQLSNGNVVGTSVQSEYAGICGALDKVGSNYINRTKIHKLYITENKHYAELDNGNVIEISENDYNALITSSGGGEGGSITPAELVEMIIAEPETDVKVDLSADGSAVVIGTHVHMVKISAPSTATNGTLTDAQVAALEESDNSFIEFGDEKYYLMDKRVTDSIVTSLTYSHVGYDNNQMWNKSITVTVANKTWVLQSCAVGNIEIEPTKSAGEGDAIWTGNLTDDQMALLDAHCNDVVFKIDGLFYRASSNKSESATFYTFICTYAPVAGSENYQAKFNAMYIQTSGVTAKKWEVYELSTN